MTLEFDLIQSPIAGNNIIEASAGTGKTYSIEGLYVRALLLPVFEKKQKEEKSTTVDKILVVTYTEAATAELRIRILEKIRKTLKGFQLTKQILLEIESFDEEIIKSNLAVLADEFIEALILSVIPQINAQKIKFLDGVVDQLKLALLSFDEAAIFTIHGFCKRMLSDYSLEAQSGFNFDFTTNQQHIIDECINDYWRNQVYQSDRKYAGFFLSYFKTPAKITAYFSHIINKPYTLLTPESNALPKDWFASLYEQYEILKKNWEDSKTAVLGILETNKAHFKATYIKKIPLMIQAMDHYFLSSNPSGIPDLLKQFTPLAIKTATKVKFEPVEHPYFDAFGDYFELMDGMKEKLVAEFIPTLIEKFRERKEGMNILSFDDLLINLNQSLTREGSDILRNKIRNRFQVAMIDEFQDTDPIQYDIFRSLFFDKIPLFLIGDPKQSIYNFRGADIFAYFKAVNDAGTKSHLKTNWRSCKDLVKAFNTIFSGTDDNAQFVFKDKIQYTKSAGSPQKPDRSLIVEDQEPAPFQFWFLKDDETSSAADIKQLFLESTVSEIVRLLNLGAQNSAKIKTDDQNSDKPVEPKDIAILVTSHSQADLFQNALSAKNIPSVQRGTRNIFETKEFTEVQIFLKAVLEYHNEAALRPVFVTEFFNIQGANLLKLFENEALWEKKVDDFQILNQIWKQNGVFAMMQSFMDKEKIREKFLSFKSGERKLSNLIQISEILQRAQMENQLDNNALIQWMGTIKQFPDDYADNEIRLETDDDALSILTVHSSKGLQFPIVFCPYSWSQGKVMSEVMFHDPDNDDKLTWDLLKNADHKEKAKQEKLAEQVRLAYVAFTRAKCCCYIMWGKINKTKDSCYTYLFNKNVYNSDKKFKDITIEDYWTELEALQERSNGAIAVSDLTDASEISYQPKTIEHQALIAQTLDKDLWVGNGVYSFTGLTDKNSFQQPDAESDDHDIAEVETATAAMTTSTELLLLDFPGGVTTGNFFHDVLEHTDFYDTEPPVTLVASKLKEYGFDAEWQPVVSKLVENVRTLPINSDYATTGSFSFADIPLKQIVKEMSFYFAMHKVSISKARSMIKSRQKTPNHLALLNSFNSIQHADLNGYMKGFIDMVFCYQNRYYILDWKTNNLGSNLQDYAKGHMQSKINDFHYNLQYYIYSIALHKYLKTRIPDYQFDKHFGGVYYLFLRGIQENSDKFGVYYESLAESGALIEALASLFQGAENV